MNGNKIFFSCFVLVFGGLILFICYLIVNKDYLFKKHEYSYTKDEYFDLTDYTIEVTDVALITSITQGRNVYKADVLSMNVKRMCQNSPTFTVAYNEGEKKFCL